MKFGRKRRDWLDWYWLIREEVGYAIEAAGRALGMWIAGRKW